MSTGTGSKWQGAAFVLLPVLGLLFFSVPWEQDPRAEPDGKRLERLNNPRKAYLVDVMVNFHKVWTYDAPWDGLLPWQEKERARLLAKVPVTVPAVVTKQRLLEERLGEVDDQTAVVMIVKEGGDPNRTLRGGVTPLEAAIKGRNIDEFRALLERGADMEKQTSSGEKPLQMVINQCAYQNAVAWYERCVTKFGSRAACLLEKDSIATSRSRDVLLVSFVNALLGKGATPRIVISKERVPLERDNDQPRDITLVELAKRRCPDFVIDALSGKPSATEKEQPKANR